MNVKLKSLFARSHFNFRDDLCMLCVCVSVIFFFCLSAYLFLSQCKILYCNIHTYTALHLSISCLYELAMTTDDICLLKLFRYYDETLFWLYPTLYRTDSLLDRTKIIEEVKWNLKLWSAEMKFALKQINSSSKMVCRCVLTLILCTLFPFDEYNENLCNISLGSLSFTTGSYWLFVIKYYPVHVKNLNRQNWIF